MEDCCVAPIGELPSWDGEFKAAKLFCINVTRTTLPRVALVESPMSAFPIATR